MADIIHAPHVVPEIAPQWGTVVMQPGISIVDVTISELPERASWRLCCWAHGGAVTMTGRIAGSARLEFQGGAGVDPGREIQIAWWLERTPAEG